MIHHALTEELCYDIADVSYESLDLGGSGRWHLFLDVAGTRLGAHELRTKWGRLPG